jgi:hypothetical protein
VERCQWNRGSEAQKTYDTVRRQRSMFASRIRIEQSVQPALQTTLLRHAHGDQRVPSACAAILPFEEESCVGGRSSGGGEHTVVTRQFLFLPQLPPRNPHERLKPDESADNLEQYAPNEVAALNMRQLMAENAEAVIDGQLAEAGWHENDGPKDSPGDRRANAVVFEQGNAAVAEPPQKSIVVQRARAGSQAPKPMQPHKEPRQQNGRAGEPD